MQTWRVILLLVLGLLGLVLGFVGWIIDLLQVEDAMTRRRRDGAEREKH